MCLGIPGKVIETYNRDAVKFGIAAFGSAKREVCLEYLPEVQVGDYILVHVGFALSIVDENEAEETMNLLREISTYAEGGESTKNS